MRTGAEQPFCFPILAQQTCPKASPLTREIRSARWLDMQRRIFTYFVEFTFYADASTLKENAFTVQDRELDGLAKLNCKLSILCS
jgi:hypothetical protein